MGARCEQLLEPLVVFVQSFPVKLCNPRDFLSDGISLGRREVLFQEPLLEGRPIGSYVGRQGMVPNLHPIVQGERQSEGFYCILITTDPSSGGTDNLKSLMCLMGSSLGLPQNFGRRFINPDLSSKFALSLGNLLGWLSKVVIAPPNCLRVSLSAMACRPMPGCVYMASLMRTHRLQLWPSRFCRDPFVPLALSGHFRSELCLLNPETLKHTYQGIMRNGKQFKTQ
ncbi:hypothetical protein PIB30_033879 [Stylosanthes scabra]|uniref:Uncharacterized protein n=1 Tax=Stylosanthes scabra TaxID=79078 RepID=A0ABU6TCC7_9FABA|nr:hypothetical protein [Stylosanthes scabra]